MSETHALRPVNLGPAAESEVVRDERHKGFFWQDNEIIRVYGPLIGPNGLAVYSCLAFHADNSRRVRISYPSYQTIAREIGSSKSTVKRAMVLLVEWNIVALVRRKSGGGDDDSSLKVLLPKEEWKPVPITPEDAPEITEDMSDDAILEAVKRGKGGFNMNPPVPNRTQGRVKNGGRVGSKSGHDLGHEQEPLKKNQIEQKPSTTACDAAVEDSSESIETPSATIQTSPVSVVKQQLSDFAAARSISLADADANALIENWAPALLPDDGLAGALTSDFARYGLDEAVGEIEAAKMVRADAKRLRWFLCVWPAFKESTDAYHEKTGHKWTKTQCFVKRWRKEQPPASWLEEQLRALKDFKAQQAHEREQSEVEAFWATLSPRQKRALDDDALADLRERQPATHFDLRSPELRDNRWKMLRDGETRRWLLEMPAEAAQKQASAEGEFNEADYEDLGAAAPPVQLRFESIIGAILQDVNAGRVKLARLDSARPALLEDEEWSEVKREVTLRLAA